LQKNLARWWRLFCVVLLGFLKGVSQKERVSVWFLDGKNVVNAW
jgi:hypothetical protein